MRFRAATLWLALGVLISQGEAVLAEEPAALPKFADLPAQPELPDALKMLDGTPVTTKEQWYKQRRPELKRLFQHYMYGFAPAAPKEVTAELLYADPQAFGGKALVEEIALTVGPGDAPKINLLFITPNERKAPAPVFVAVNFCGNHTVLADPKIKIPSTWMYKHCPGCIDDKATEAGRGGQKDVWCAEQLIDRGYALATFYNGDIDPDQPDFQDGIHRHFLKEGQKEVGQHDWGAIAAWAWGVSRVVDFLQNCSEVDKTQICVTGHSRLGKTALLAGAMDERIAIVVPHQSGTGGCALSRDNDQETVERINRVFPHWFNDAFNQFSGHEDRLPVDQHLLMALVAPRALLTTEGHQDKWANYTSGFRALQAADKVYKFLGAKGMNGTGLIENNESMDGPNFGDLVQYRRDTTHVLNADYWSKILDFADQHLAARKR